MVVVYPRPGTMADWRPGWTRWAARGLHALNVQGARVPGRQLALAGRGEDIVSPAGGLASRAGPGDAILGDFEAFFRRYERDIFSYLARMTGDEAAAYDLSQETFIRAWREFAKIRGYDRPRAWLFRVASNLALNHLRQRGGPLGGAESLGSVNDPAVSDPAWRLVERDAVRETLLRLPPRQRAALVLREVYGLSCAEVGQALGISTAATKMALLRAREGFKAGYRRAEGADWRGGRS